MRPVVYSALATTILGLFVFLSLSTSYSANDKPTLWWTISTPPGLVDVVVNPDTGRLYTAQQTYDVNVLDAQKGQLLDTMHAVGGNMAVNRATNRLYASDWFHGSVTVIDLQTDTVLSTISVPEKPLDLAIDPAQDRIFVDSNQPVISVIDGKTNAVVDSIDRGPGPMAFDPVSNRLYLLAYQGADTSSKLVALNGDTGKVVAQVGVGREAKALAVDSVDQKVYVASSVDGSTGTGQLWVVDASNFDVLAQVPTNKLADSLAVNSVTHRAYVGQFYDDSVAVFAPTGERVATVSLEAGSSPTSVAIDEIHNLTYVANANAPSVSVIGSGPAPATPTHRTTPTPLVTPAGFGRGGGPIGNGGDIPLATLGLAVAMTLAGGIFLRAARRA